MRPIRTPRGAILRVLPCVLLAVCTAALAQGAADAGPDPLAFFSPVVTPTAGDRQRLDAGGTIARVVKAHAGSVAVYCATSVNADGDRLVRWVRDIEALKQSTYVEAIGRFSDPPQPADLAALRLPDDDVRDLATCRPGRCGLKLSAAEITSLQPVLRGPAGAGDEAVQEAFRALVLARVRAYLAGGHRRLEAFDDRPEAASLDAAFAGLASQSAFLDQQMPGLTEFLRRWPDASMPGVETFLYWSREKLGRKAVISVTQIAIVRGNSATLPEAISISKQVFATHYMEASLGVTVLTLDPARSRRYIAYLNRSDLDMLDGFWGGLVRRMLERRLRSEAPAVLEGLRQRLESGEPPQ